MTENRKSYEDHRRLIRNVDRITIIISVIIVIIFTAILIRNHDPDDVLKPIAPATTEEARYSSANWPVRIG